MLHPHVTILADRQMTARRITARAAAAGTVYRVTTSLPSERPPVVCLCGSTRFYDEFRRANLRLTLAGQIVLSIGCDTKSDQDLTTAGALSTDPAALKARLDELHLRKIDLADYVLVLNVGGYTGPSTQNEIAYARAADKPVRYLEPPGPGPDEWACQACGDAWHGTPPESGTCPGGCRAA